MRYFKLSEFDCKETGENKMSKEFLNKLDDLRHYCGFSFVVNSGYRSTSHSAEKHKSKGGTHTQGIAADIRVSNGVQRIEIVSKAIELGFTGIGVAKGFVHVDIRNDTPVMWTY
ncbi:peptidase [Pseudoalteromonas phage HS1]|uniref:endolysin n=1 Tax=Pseudoalteromonas phage H105/1 TaxID=877240 RepID=UPI0001E439F5|nr:endolysin [Pseudoalteromonas phage H105/1]YP_010660088.1 peptidase [Pseudoalteromonas phage HS5]YP_010660221.1 peptidase [Pseudoalteromonas phage HS1]ADM26710.1 carboxypeptidase [Pseudoalteromonas phage H105/1]